MKLSRHRPPLHHQTSNLKVRCILRAAAGKVLPECCAVHDFMTDRLLQGTGIEQMGDPRSGPLFLEIQKNLRYLFFFEDQILRG